MSKRALPSKESGLFKELLALYESKQLKKGIKTADAILKKFPEHGETLCMKGLLLTHLGRRDEGVDLVKKGVRLDLTSHICWHVFGLIQKGEKNYEEALKSYTQALRFDRENLNILRDAAQLQAQLRLYDGLVETRLTLVRLRPNLRQHWIALAVAYQLAGNLAETKKVLEQYERMLKNVPDYDVEHSETTLYHIRVLEEMGLHAEALAMLDVNAKSRAIVDRTAIMEIRARLLSTLKSDEAEHAWRALVEHNSDNLNYYKGYLSSRLIDIDNLTDDSRSKALTILLDFTQQIPRATAPRRLALSVATGEQFTSLAQPYIQSALDKGIPSLFTDIKSLYTDSSKRDAVEKIVQDITSSEPTVQLWKLYFLAQHYSYLGRHQEALEIIERALADTPTLPDLYTAKARILKRAGDLYGASKALEEARLLDGQDRFLNTKSAKYKLRCGLVHEANQLLGLFTKKDAPSPGADLTDMQSMLYLTEEGDAHYRNGHLGMALKRYLSIEKVFEEIQDDQYDFHGYSIRKFVINMYIDMLTWEDKLRSHPAYVKAAINSSKILVAVHDDPSLLQTSSISNQLSDAEKRAKKKAKKAAKAQEEQKKAPTQATNEDKGLDAPTAKGDDPDGSKALAMPDPLEKASKLLAPLRNLVPSNVEMWCVVYDVAIRRSKYLQAIQALHHAKALDADAPELHPRIVHLRQKVSSLSQVPPSPIGPVLTSSLNELIPDDLSLESYNSQYLQRHSESAAHVLAAAKVSRQLGEPYEDLIFGAIQHANVKIARDILDFLNLVKSERADEFRKKCDEHFALSTVFKTKDEVEALWTTKNEGEEALEDIV